MPLQGLELGDDVTLLTVGEQGPPGPGGGGGGGGHIVQENAVNLAARTHLNFAGGILATDNVGTDTTDVTVTTGLIGAIPTSEKGANSGVATLDSGGKVPTAQLPSFAITEVFVVGSQAAMLALAAQTGDIAVRTDEGVSYILSAIPATEIANWVELAAPGNIVSVNGQTGPAVNLDAADVGAVDDGDVGAPNGVAALDGSGDVPDGQIASSIARVADVLTKATYDANTIVKADTDNTPVALTMGASTILARLAAGNIVAATTAQIKTLLGLVTADITDFDATLTALAGLTTAADQMIYSTGVNAFAMTGLTAFSRTLLDDADATAWKDTLGLNALVAGARIDLPAPSGGSQTIDVDMSEGQAGNQTWNGGLNDSDTLTIQANAGTNAGQLQLLTAAELDLTSSAGTIDMNAPAGAFTLDAVSVAIFGSFGCTANNLTVTTTADETGTATPIGAMVYTGTATNDDIVETWRPSKILTTGSTITTIQTISAATIPADTGLVVEAKVLGHRTSGSGSAGDSASYYLYGTFRDVAGTVTQVGTTSVLASHENVGGWDCIMEANGGTVRIRVTGATTTNISWSCRTLTHILGT